MQYKTADVVVLGGGPAGLAAAISACEAGAQVILLEREKRLGGILKQCIHDGFGLIRFGEKLSGPEYAQRFIDRFHEMGIEALTETFVTKIEAQQDAPPQDSRCAPQDAPQDTPPHRFRLTASGRDGMIIIEAAALVLATGCRERTARQVSVHGSRPAGIFTAGTAQHLINLQGQMPTKRCVILGSGDIGLIMARRLTLEGAEVVGVYEAKPQPSGLIRNIHQCLYDFDIPLHLSTTVTRVFGEHRVEEVEVCKVDETMQTIPETEERIACDSLILSVGLIPENELAESLGIQIDPATRGPLTDEEKMTSVPGVFSCGNAYRVYDLVDDVSTDGELAGRAAAAWSLRSTRMDGGAGDCGAGIFAGKEAGV